MKNYKVINILSPTLRTVFIGSQKECVELKDRLGFGYSVSRNKSNALNLCNKYKTLPKGLKDLSK